MSIDIEGIFKVIAYGVPALMVLGGLILLFLGYPINHSDMITGGWALVIFGAIIYVIEIIIEYLG